MEPEGEPEKDAFRPPQPDRPWSGDVDDLQGVPPGRRFWPCRGSVVRVVCMVREASIDPERVTLRSLPSSIPCGPRSEAWPSCG